MLASGRLTCVLSLTRVCFDAKMNLISDISSTIYCLASANTSCSHFPHLLSEDNNSVYPKDRAVMRVKQDDEYNMLSIVPRI